jgi:pantothenate kinase
MSLDALASEAIKLAKRVGGRVVIGIVGPPGAGKSTLAEALSERIGEQACAVPMDGFHLAQSTLAYLNIADRKGSPDTFDVHGYAALLRRMRQELSSTVYAPEFRRSLEDPVAGAIAIPPTASIVLTEGNFLLLETEGWGQVADLLDETWYVELSDEIRRERLVSRHRMFGKTESQARNWVAEVDENNAILVASSKHRANRTVSVG